MNQFKKIKLFGARDFSGNFDMTMNFVKQNYFKILKPLCYFIPLLLVAAYFMPNIFKIYYSLGMGANPDIVVDGMFGVGLMIAYLVLLVTMFVIALYTISYMAVYAKSADGEVESSEVWSNVTKAALPVFAASVLFMIAVTIGTLLCIIPGIIISVYLMFFAYIQVNEDLGIIDSFKRSYELVQHNWWVTLGFYVVISFIISFVSSIFVIPMYIGMFGSMFQVEFLASDIFSYASMFLAFVGNVLLYPIMYIALGVMYYSHRSKHDGVDMESEIDSIGVN